MKQGALVAGAAAIGGAVLLSRRARRASSSRAAAAPPPARRMLRIFGWTGCPHFERAKAVAIALAAMYPEAFALELVELADRAAFVARLGADDVRRALGADDHATSPLALLGADGYIGGADELVAWSRRALADDATRALVAAAPGGGGGGGRWGLPPPEAPPPPPPLRSWWSLRSRARRPCSARAARMLTWRPTARCATLERRICPPRSYRRCGGVRRNSRRRRRRCSHSPLTAACATPSPPG